MLSNFERKIAQLFHVFHLVYMQYGLKRRCIHQVVKVTEL